MLRAVASKTVLSRLPLLPALTRAHCQVPCGIFDDPVRVTQLKEDAATVRKAMVQINELSGAGTALSLNQATRWIMAKEDHAKAIISTVAEYMLCQRVKKVRAPSSRTPSPRAPRAPHGRAPAAGPPGGPLLTPAHIPTTSRRAQELFENEADYLQALAAHHSVLAAAVKTKQVVDPAACDALDHAIEDVSKMYTK